MLLNNPYKQLTTKEIKARGWLERELRLQADGLSGHLQECWPDIARSQWIGGDREGWERVPYWLDGFIPLAYLLGDEKLIADAKRYVNFIIDKQMTSDQPIWDGWICPVKDEEALLSFDEWAVILICKALIVYYDCSSDDRIPGVIYRILKNLSFRLEHFAIKTWGSYRWYEALIAIYWMHDRCGEGWLLNMARNLWEQGADYKKIFRNWDTKKPYTSWTLRTHVVNLAMAIKSEALFAPILDIEGEKTDPDEFAEHMYEMLLKYHGTAVGHFTGDECISGDSPVHGTELCGVVEAMYSYEWLYAITGKTKWLDRAEQLAFNALPAGLTEDMWARQYDQMTNQISCAKYEPGNTPFLTNGIDGGLFGLEPNYGCCTANFSQGWPKFALSTFMRTDRGLASCALAPSEVALDINGTSVRCVLDTDYPFRNTLTYSITAEKPCEFDFEFRIPACAASAVVDGIPVSAGKHTVSRVWEGTTTITVEIVPEVRFAARPRGLYTLYRGALAYSLPIGEKWEKLEYTEEGVERKFPYCDYEVTPTTDWAFAFASDEAEFHENDGWTLPYTRENPPVWAQVKLCPINWGFKEGFEGKVAREEPLNRTPAGEVRTVKLLPYGIPKLRMTELPMADK